MNLKRLTGLLIAAFSAFLLGACQPHSEVAWKLYTVKADDLTLSVNETGTLGSQQEETLRVPFDGTLVQLMNEGSIVKKGQVIGRLETSAQQDERNAAELSLKEARGDLKLAQLNEQQSKAQLASDLKLANLAVQMENLKLRKLKEERDPVTAVRLRASATALQQQLQILELEAKERERLFKLGYLSEQERDEAQQQLEESRKEQERLRAEQTVFDQGPRPEDIHKQELALAKAQDQLKKLNQEAKVQRAVSSVKARGAELSIKKYQQRYTYYDDLIKAGHLITPAAGTVIYGKVKAGQDEFPVKAGDAVKEGEAVFRVVDMEHPLVRLTVHEIDAPRIQRGQKALIRLDAYPEMALTGTVNRLLPIAGQILDNDELELQGFSAEITLDKGDERLRPGMTASVEIITRQFKQVLAVPSQALVQHENENYCWVLVKGHPEKRPLSLGVSDARYTQVVSGLEAGESVILNPEVIS